MLSYLAGCIIDKQTLKVMIGETDADGETRIYTEDLNSHVIIVLNKKYYHGYNASRGRDLKLYENESANKNKNDNSNDNSNENSNENSNANCNEVILSQMLSHILLPIGLFRESSHAYILLFNILFEMSGWQIHSLAILQFCKDSAFEFELRSFGSIAQVVTKIIKIDGKFSLIPHSLVLQTRTDKRTVTPQGIQYLYQRLKKNPTKFRKAMRKVYASDKYSTFIGKVQKAEAKRFKMIVQK